MDNRIDFIFTRRSVRSFVEHTISDEELHTLLSAGMSSPSACCQDPWEFLVVRDRELLKQVATIMPNGPFLATASVGILVCGNINKAHAGSLSYMLQDCSAAIENILLAANAIELGGCWLGVHPREERIADLEKIFNFPAGVIPVGMLAIGLPASKPIARSRYNQELVHDASEWLK